MSRIAIVDANSIVKHILNDSSNPAVTTQVPLDDTYLTTGIGTQLPTYDANAATLKSRAKTALTGNATYLAIGSPTTAQAITQVAALTKQCDGIIRLLIGQLDSTAGT